MINQFAAVRNDLSATAKIGRIMSSMILVVEWKIIELQLFMLSVYIP